MTIKDRRPSFVLYPDSIRWQRITDQRVGALLKQAVQSLMEVNESILAIERERNEIRGQILAAWGSADVLTMREMNARFRDCGKRLANRHYWRITIEDGIKEVARERRRIFGTKP